MVKNRYKNRVKERHDETAVAENWHCMQCGAENRAPQTGCTACGTPRFTLDDEFGKKSVYSVLPLYFVLLFAIIYINLAEPGGSGWRGELWAALIFAGITLAFVFFDLRDFSKYIFPSRFRWRVFLPVLLLAPLFSFTVTQSANWVNHTFFSGYATRIDRYADAPQPLLYAVLLTAVFPAVFEELAFRGVIFSRGRGAFSLRQTVWVSSVLFTFLHLSYISFVWVFPFAWVLGWLRARYRTTFYGMCIHFLHNFTAVLLAHYGYDNFL